MITPEEIVRKARRKYRTVLRDYLVPDKDDLFPMIFSVGRLSKKLAERRNQIDRLRHASGEVTEDGYDLQWKTVNKRRLGTQTTPTHAVIPDRNRYLALVRKRTEFQNFVNDVEKIRRRFPELENWLRQSPHHVIEYQGNWDDLLTVCDYFVRQPRPNVYLRELPITVHTKFIESHTGILREVLDSLLPDDSLNAAESDFVARFGLKEKPALVRMRLLEEQLEWQLGLSLDDLTLPVRQLAHLLRDHIQPKRVIIVENLINFLTLPTLPEAVGLFGGGFAVHLLRDVDWLQQCDILYWGDIDVQGFQMLSDLRCLFPHTRSVMMSQEMLDTHADYVVTGTPARHESFEGLSVTERELVQYLIDHNLRLEQEHISHQEAIQRLKQKL